MELQWDKTQIGCLKSKLRQAQNQEQTLEIRLPEDMPDIARVICGWGQAVLRGKEWYGDGMGISGGIMAWVLYAPEDGSEPRMVEGWLPFQMKWNFPQGSRDGAVVVNMQLRGVDARVLSARKMMVRAMVSVLGEGLEPDTADVYQPVEHTQNVELLRRTYPVVLPVEAGEKTFQVEDDLAVNGIRPVRIIANTVTPMIAEEKVLGGKAVFRGDCRIHLVYTGEDGKIHSADLELPFAQYSDLDRDHGKDATVATQMALSNLETELMEGSLRVKCGLTAQYVVCEEACIHVVEDAYGLRQEVAPIMQDLILPAVLDSRREEKKITASTAGDWTNIVDATSYLEQLVARRSDLSVDIELPGTVQLLCLNDAGQYHGATARFHSQWSVPAGEGAEASVTVIPSGVPSVAADGENISVTLPIMTQTVTTTMQNIPVVAGLQMGQPRKEDPCRPSLILRRSGRQTLWDLAKHYGTTVEAIQNANQLEDQPGDDRMLLIPVS